MGSHLNIPLVDAMPAFSEALRVAIPTRGPRANRHDPNSSAIFHEVLANIDAPEHGRVPVRFVLRQSEKGVIAYDYRADDRWLADWMKERAGGAEVHLDGFGERPPRQPGEPGPLGSKVTSRPGACNHDDGPDTTSTEGEDVKFSVSENAPQRTVTAYKFFRHGKCGPLDPLFIGAKKPVLVGEWARAKHIPTTGFAERPGWHTDVLPVAPHLRIKEDRRAAEDAIRVAALMHSELRDAAAATKAVKGQTAEKRIVRQASDRIMPAPAAQKPDWANAASALVVQQLKPIDQPHGGSERITMRSAVTKAMQMLRDAVCKRITPAYFQAILWFAEKEFWAKFGGKEDDTPKLSSGLQRLNMDYHQAMALLAKQKGIAKDFIAP